MSIIFLYSKDALCTENLPIYGNKYWETPNLDELAEKGTVFFNHHTTAASTSMSFSCMLTGKYAHEFEKRKRYENVSPNEKPSIFSILQESGYECHVIWSEDYLGDWDRVREFGDESKTKLHIVDMHQPAGEHRPRGVVLERNDELIEQTKNNIYNELNSIDTSSNNVFIWLHLPHVLKGRASYGDDIDVFDEILGFIRNKYGDESIYITADHGHMNLHKDIPGYGFHVYELTCRVPLITPRIGNIEKVEQLTSHVDLIHLLLDKKIVYRDFIYVDTQYYAQPDRKLAVISERYKYIYNKRGGSEELYDLIWDPGERYNLIENERFNSDKKMLQRVSELYFYPYRNQVQAQLEYLRGKKNSIWRVGTRKDEIINRLRNDASKIRNSIKARKQMRE